MPDGAEEGQSFSQLLVFVATAATVAALIGIGAIWFLGTSSTVGCEYKEAREGSSFVQWKSLQLDDVRQLAKERQLQIKLETAERSSVAPGTVVDISRCGVPLDTLLVTVASDRR